jgi:hypothetical protein
MADRIGEKRGDMDRNDVNEDMPRSGEEQIRGVGDDEDFEDTEDLDEEEDEEENEEGSF